MLASGKSLLGNPMLSAAILLGSSIAHAQQTQSQPGMTGQGMMGCMMHSGQGMMGQGMMGMHDAMMQAMQSGTAMARMDAHIKAVETMTEALKALNAGD